MSCRRDMTYNFSERKPLLHYSDQEERANFFDTEELDSSMPRRKRSGKQKKGKRQSTGKGLKGVKFSKGRLALRIGGYSGVQRLAPSQLVRYIPLAKLKQAARKVLAKTGGKKIKRRKGRKGRKGKRKNTV